MEAKVIELAARRQMDYSIAGGYLIVQPRGLLILDKKAGKGSPFSVKGSHCNQAGCHGKKVIEQNLRVRI